MMSRDDYFDLIDRASEPERHIVGLKSGLIQVPPVTDAGQLAADPISDI
jgi:hypothetical protein